MRKIASALTAFLIILSLGPPAAAQESEQHRPYTGPVIDVHLHAFAADANGPAPNGICVGAAANLQYTGQEPWPVAMSRLSLDPPCEDPIRGPATDAEVLAQTIAQMERYDVTGILSSTAEEFATWSAAASDRFMRGLSLNIRRDGDLSAEEAAAAYERGEFMVMAEVTNQYSGVLADDPAFEPYWQVAADRGIPVGIHLGVGPPGAPMLYPDFRAQSPLRMEEVLSRHPDLRVYLMHAGFPFADDVKALLYLYPQLYLDTGVLQIAAPREEYYAFLEEIVRAGFGDRIMFGSDQMNWPGLIGEGIDAINDAPFLTYEQKKAILYDNAARFFAPELEPLAARD
ncbi:amidohydrolase family protein [Aurantiacibacter zhengii]|uniref:Amidohydrolase n=1 Tax=Aurantiacibacter zhengii TaxID=2307003 RepID=A0A418NNZ6_9SPHN|nr:amidohydrolase [Aurantiacibacter zhengii]